jgi:hypothetical protein
MSLANGSAGVPSGAIRVVEYTMRLELPPARWERVAEIIEAAIEATEAGDLEKLRLALEDLAQASPLRVIRPDGWSLTRADRKVYERANVLIHALQSMRPPGPVGADGDVVGPDDDAPGADGRGR